MSKLIDTVYIVTSGWGSHVWVGVKHTSILGKSESCPWEKKTKRLCDMKQGAKTECK